MAKEKTAGFAPIDLPLVTLGLDVITPEGDLPPGAVRRASNVMFHDNGAYDRRPGYEALTALAGAHSFWRGRNGSYVAADGTLYTFNGTSVTALATGLPPEDPVEYAERGSDVFFTSNGTLRQITQGLVRAPGVASLLGEYPTLTATTGSMRSGRYGVAYSLVNDLGVESGISSSSFITATGITVSNIVAAPNATHMKIYATHADGETFYLYQTLTYAATAAVTDAYRGAEADKLDLIPLPGGEFIREYRGRLYVGFDVWLFYSPPYAPGLSHIHDGYLQFGKPITMIEAVDGGLYVGFADDVIFLRGTGPEDFVVTATGGAGAVPHSSILANADLFNPEAQPRQKLAVWLSPKGVALGHPDGSVGLPQASRIRVSSSRACASLLLLQGIRQLIFACEDLTFPEPDDATTLAYINVGAGGISGHGSGSFSGLNAALSAPAFGSNIRNLLSYSEQFDNGAWTIGEMTVAPNATMAPDGTMSAERLVPDVGNTAASISQGVAVPLTTLGTVSFFAKADGCPAVTVFYDIASITAVVNFDLVNGAVYYVAGSIVPRIEPAANGFYRCSMTLTAPGFPFPTTTPVLLPTGLGGGAGFPGADGVKGIYLWGMQFEIGTLTPYQPTPGSAGALIAVGALA